MPRHVVTLPALRECGGNLAIELSGVSSTGHDQCQYTHGGVISSKLEQFYASRV